MAITRIEPEPKIIEEGFESGAQSSARKPRYDLVPRSIIERLAMRFTLGAEKYPPFNYRKGLEDKEFILDRINHIFEHLNAFLAPENKEEDQDDNLAAIAWGITFLMEVQKSKKGLDILHQIMTERSSI